jgi:hypothetical protein
MSIVMPWLSGHEILNQADLKNQLNEIKSLISCPDDIYNQLYLSILKRLAEYCQAMPFSETEFNCDYGFLNRQLKLASTVLKIRRGILFPKNAGAEKIASEESQWTYGLFSGALLKDLYQLHLNREVQLFDENKSKLKIWSAISDSLSENKYLYEMQFVTKKTDINIHTTMEAFIKIMISQVSRGWIYKNQFLFSQWWDVLLHISSGSNDIEEIIAKSAGKVAISLASIQSTLNTKINPLGHESEQVNHLILDDNLLKGWS